MEYLDTYDENQNFLGAVERNIVHRDALWHNTVHCWLYDQEGNVYFQIRSDKKKLYTTASGHVKAGETIKEAFGREIAEEIGYTIDYEKAELIKVVKFTMDREEEDGSIFRDRAFANVYACQFDDEFIKLNFDEEELAGIVRMDAQKALEIVTNEQGQVAGEKVFKKNHEIMTKKENITFEDFLVNKGETAIGKYGEVLNFIISKRK